VRLSKTPAHTGERMPEYGEHTDEILGGWLGLGADAIADLRTREIIR
jgi:crotonobetainyl-CoA:carnitine CoA-transferase CaiB-like acyl-CoA transferase